MPTITSTKDFITIFINNCSIVKSSRLDNTIKALINNSTRLRRDNIILYLNKIRIVYYLKRLEYRKPTKAKEYKSKLLFYLTILTILITP